MFITLSYPAPVSESVVHVVEESGSGCVVFDEVVLFVVDLACLSYPVGGR